MSGLISIQSPSQWQDVLNSTNVVVADFYADWCGPCNAIAPHFEKMANEDAARGAGPGGKARAPPARPSAFRTLADLGKDE
ncbi:hypothetical protein VdG1_07891 [Verticillium dahliae VDG1]|nr:hypothetical protein VdG1_07891 [Verticillium dahliae VDG1]